MTAQTKRKTLRIFIFAFDEAFGSVSLGVVERYTLSLPLGTRLGTLWWSL